MLRATRQTCACKVRRAGSLNQKDAWYDGSERVRRHDLRRRDESRRTIFHLARRQKNSRWVACSREARLQGRMSAVHRRDMDRHAAPEPAQENGRTHWTGPLTPSEGDIVRHLPE